MTAGRKPTPTNLKLLDNNPGKRAINHNEPKPRPSQARPPSHLGKEARAEWRRMVAILFPLGLFTEMDKAALAAYSTAWERHVDAEKNLQKYGMVVVSPRGFPMQSPYVSLANKAFDQMLRALAEFGMSPSSRSRVTATPPGAGKSKWAGLLDDD